MAHASAVLQRHGDGRVSPAVGAAACAEGLLRHGQAAGRVSRASIRTSIWCRRWWRRFRIMSPARRTIRSSMSSPSRRRSDAAERRFALHYLFQANPVNMIGRYPRYRDLWDRYRTTSDAARGSRVVLRHARLRRFAGAVAAGVVRRVLSGRSRHRGSGAERRRLHARRSAAGHRESSARCWPRFCPLMPRRRSAERSSFRRRRSIIRFCRCSAIRMRARSRRPDCRCRRGVSSIPTTPRCRSSVRLIRTRSFSACGRRACGRRRAASRKKR